MLRDDVQVRVTMMRVWRLAARAHRRGAHRSAKVLAALARTLWTADIPPSTVLGRDVVFMHNGLGVVLHRRVTFLGPAVVFQHVTLGDDFRSGPDGAPTIGARVVLGAGAMVLGPVTIGEGSVVGAGAVVTRDVPANSLAVGNPATVRPLRDSAVHDTWFVAAG